MCASITALLIDALKMCMLKKIYHWMMAGVKKVTHLIYSIEMMDVVHSVAVHAGISDLWKSW